MGQFGFFDADRRLAAITAKGDPLEMIARVVPFESFRAEIEAAVLTPVNEKKSTAGRKPIDVMVMFRMLVLQSLYNLSDEQVEYQVRDRLSFTRLYMDAQLARVGRAGPQVIGIDEIAIRKGHTYRIVVSDLRRGRPIWFGGDDRSEASMAQFYAWLGARKSARILDMWKPFRLATQAHAPQAAILFDKFPCHAPSRRAWIRTNAIFPFSVLARP